MPLSRVADSWRHDSQWEMQWLRSASAGTRDLFSSSSWKGKERQITKALSMAKSPQAAEQIFHAIALRGAQANKFHFTAIITAWVKARNPVKAEEVLSKMCVSTVVLADVVNYSSV